MRTTVDIDELLLAEAQELTGEKSPTRAVNKALAEFVRQQRIKGLLALRGKIALELDDWYEFRHRERV